MDEGPTTVVGFVTALAQCYANGLEYYTRWKRSRSQQNHYRRRTTAGGGTCALSSSLSMAGTQVKETYDIAFAVVGAEFSTGDTTCRDSLRAQLVNLRNIVSDLRRSSSATTPCPLNLSDALSVTESTRKNAVQALTDQYQRISVGRPIPSELPVPKPRSRQDGRMRQTTAMQELYQPPAAYNYDYDDTMTTAMTVISGTLRFQSEPPSPPLTPKRGPEDTESSWGGPLSDGGRGGPTLLKNSVFSIFCSEAMALQVDVSRPVPTSRKCGCGYRWKLTLPDKKEVVLLKEGFRMTARFLAKSHCGSEPGGYGCVLCTSSGRTETYESAEHLRVHMNTSHTKWQMLHDRDMK